MRVDRYEQWPINVRTIVIETDAYVENCGKNSTADLAFLTLFLSISCIPKKNEYNLNGSEKKNKRTISHRKCSNSNFIEPLSVIVVYEEQTARERERKKKNPNTGTVNGVN